MYKEREDIESLDAEEKAAQEGFGLEENPERFVGNPHCFSKVCLFLGLITASRCYSILSYIARLFF